MRDEIDFALRPLHQFGRHRLFDLIAVMERVVGLPGSALHRGNEPAASTFRLKFLARFQYEMVDAQHIPGDRRGNT